MRLRSKISLAVLPAVILGSTWAAYDLWARMQARERIKAAPERVEEEDDPDDACYMGWHYNRQKEYEKAFPYFLKAANGGVVSAMCQLGWMYKSGTGVKRDLEESLRWYRLAEANGNLWGTLGIAEAYDKGLALPVDHAKAYELYMKIMTAVGASSGVQGMAACELGRYFEQGIERPVDKAEAIKWYRIAAASTGSFGAAPRALERLKALGAPWP